MQIYRLKQKCEYIDEHEKKKKKKKKEEKRSERIRGRNNSPEYERN